MTYLYKVLHCKYWSLWILQIHNLVCELVSFHLDSEIIYAKGKYEISLSVNFDRMFYHLMVSTDGGRLITIIS